MTSEVDIARIMARLDSLERRFDRYETLMSERDQEIQAILRDIAVTTSQFSHTADTVRAVESEQDAAIREHQELKNEMRNIKSAFGLVKWFLGLIIPLLLGIAANQFFGGVA